MSVVQDLVSIRLRQLDAEEAVAVIALHHVQVGVVHRYTHDVRWKVQIADNVAVRLEQVDPGVEVPDRPVPDYESAVAVVVDTELGLPRPLDRVAVEVQ